jgi:hypothetical protein
MYVVFQYQLILEMPQVDLRYVIESFPQIVERQVLKFKMIVNDLGNFFLDFLRDLSDFCNEIETLKNDNLRHLQNDCQWSRKLFLDFLRGLSDFCNEIETFLSLEPCTKLFLKVVKTAEEEFYHWNQLNLRFPALVQIDAASRTMISI